MKTAVRQIQTVKSESMNYSGYDIISIKVGLTFNTSL